MNRKENKINYEKTLVIPIEIQMWKSLRKIAFDHEISMSQLTRDAIEKIIHKYEKNA